MTTSQTLCLTKDMTIYNALDQKHELLDALIGSDDIELDLSVSVPIVGKSLEERAMARADRAIADEEARGTAWLAEH